MARAHKGWLGLAVALLLVSCGSSAVTRSPAPVTKTIVVTGQEVVLHYTASSSEKPLVLALHGLGSSGAAFAALTKLSSFADAHGFVVAYPDAHQAPHVPEIGVNVAHPGTYAAGTAWNAGDCCGASTTDDVSYLVQVVKAVEGQLPIDAKRVYVIGLSNGGMMALRALCLAPDTFAAAGSVAGPFLGTSCSRPVWKELAWASDPVVPTRGGASPGWAYLSVPRNWCQCSFPDATEQAASFPGGDVSVSSYLHGDHGWPSAGDHAWNLDGNLELWSFVSARHL